MLRVHKAQRTCSNEQVPDLLIEAVEEFSTKRGTNWKNENMAMFQRDAKAVANALYASLPGGTLDQLLREMLERKASQFVVKF